MNTVALSIIASLLIIILIGLKMKDLEKRIHLLEVSLKDMETSKNLEVVEDVEVIEPSDDEDTSLNDDDK